MRREIAAVVFFLKRLVKRGDKLETSKVDLFVERLAVALQEKFKGHWHPENPSKGQAYRCIRVNRFYQQDPELLRACKESGVPYSDLRLPTEITLWVDPGEVCCRYAEQSPCFSVARFSNSDEEYKCIAKKVAQALERVTSDYHSGSSFGEESARTSPRAFPDSHHAHQVLNPAAPVWHPEEMVPGKGHVPPGVKPATRAPSKTRYSLWVSSVYRRPSRYLNTNQKREGH